MTSQTTKGSERGGRADVNGRRRRRTSAEDRRRGIRLVSDGYSFCAAGRVIGCNYRTVKRWWLRDRVYGSIRDRHAGASPRANTPAQEQAIVRLARRERHVTARQIKQALDPQGLLNPGRVI